MRARLAIGFLAGTLLSVPVLAQTSPPAPTGGQPAPSAQPMGQSGAASGVQYITQGRPDMWRASQLEGVDIYNNNNEKIGDVSDVLVDRNGKVEAVVIGVGGFLGIGERNVAVPFNALQWEMSDTSATAQNNAGGAAGGNQPATTGTVGNTNAPGGSAGNSSRNAPARAVLANASKEELRNAPEFKYGQ